MENTEIVKPSRVRYLIAPHKTNTSIINNPPSRRTCNVTQINEDKHIEIEAFDRYNEERTFKQLLDILKKPACERDQIDIKFIISFLNETELMNKFKSDREISEASYHHIMYMCSSYMNLVTLSENQILFKMNDIGDKFYIILKGNVTILRPVANPKLKMTPKEYFDFLLEMRNKNEKYLLKRTLEENMNVLNIPDISEFERVLSFVVRYIFLIDTKDLKNHEDVEHLCKFYQKSLVDFSVEKDDIRTIDVALRKNSIDLYKRKSTEKEWLKSIDKKLNITQEENSLYLKYIICLVKDKEKKDVTTFDYQRFISLHTGQYFGDFALDNENKRRTATIKTEDECFFGVLSIKNYEDYIQAEKFKVKNKELAFLNENFFFKLITPNIFEKKYFPLFASYDYVRNQQFYKEGHLSEKIILVKEGFIEMSFYGSLIDLHKAIVMLVNRFIDLSLTNNEKNYSIQDDMACITYTADVNYFKEFLNDEAISNLRNKPQKFLQDVNMKKKISLSLVSSKEMCGIEEIFLGNLNRVLRATVHSERAKVYKLDLESLKYLIENEKRSYVSYNKICNEKVVSLIKRLFQIKQTLIQKSLTESLKEEQNEIPIKYSEPRNRGIKIINKVTRVTGNVHNNKKSNNINLSGNRSDLMESNIIQTLDSEINSKIESKEKAKEIKNIFYNKKKKVNFKPPHNKLEDQSVKLKKIQNLTNEQNSSSRIPQMEIKKSSDSVFLSGNVLFNMRNLSNSDNTNSRNLDIISYNKSQNQNLAMKSSYRKNSMFRTYVHISENISLNNENNPKPIIYCFNNSNKSFNGQIKRPFHIKLNSNISISQLPYINRFKMNKEQKIIKNNSITKSANELEIFNEFYIDNNSKEISSVDTKENSYNRNKMCGYKLLLPPNIKRASKARKK